MAEQVTLTPGATAAVSPGSAGLATQLPGQATTVDGIASASGGVAPGELMEVDIDKDLFEFESDDTPLMQLMLASKKVSVTSPKVQHYQLDEEKTTVTTTTAVSANTSNTQFELPLPNTDKKLCQPCTTLRVRGVNGYNGNGQSETPNVDLMLYVIGVHNTSGNPIVIAINGAKNNATDAECTVPAIPAGSVVDILGNALHETQRKVEPDSSKPVPELLFLQKRGMNRVVSDYFESQKKRLPSFTNALLAERAIRKFKRAGNRTLWASVQGEFTVNDPETGIQTVLTTKGILYQFKRVMEHAGKWNYRDFISLAKMFFTGVDVPNAAYCLCGKNFLESIQCIDFSEHPEIVIEVKHNKLGWSVTSIHTVFGDFEFKWEPTLDKLGFENSAAIIGAGRTVHYQRTPEHSEKERIDGHEANRESIIVWDAIGLKGSCHVFVNGENDATIGAEDALNFSLWDKETAPASPADKQIFYLTQNCPGINAAATKGELWQYTAPAGSGTGTWAKFADAEI